MAVDNQPPPVQPESPRLPMSRDFIQVIGAAAALAAVIIAGMALVVSMTVAPVREDMRLLHEDMRSLRTEIQSEFKAARSDMADIREHLRGWRPCLSGIWASPTPIRTRSLDGHRKAPGRCPGFVKGGGCPSGGIQRIPGVPPLYTRPGAAVAEASARPGSARPGSCSRPLAQNPPPGCWKKAACAPDSPPQRPDSGRFGGFGGAFRARRAEVRFGQYLRGFPGAVKFT